MHYPSKAQWSLYVPHSGHCMYRTVVTICTAQWSLHVPHSGHYMCRSVAYYMYRPVVTICTAQWSLYVPPSGHYMYHQFNIHNSTFCPHSVFMCFVWISEQTAIISLYNTDWLVFVTETESVYCAVRTGCLSVIQVRSSLGRFDGGTSYSGAFRSSSEHLRGRVSCVACSIRPGFAAYIDRRLVPAHCPASAALLHRRMRDVKTGGRILLDATWTPPFIFSL